MIPPLLSYVTFNRLGLTIKSLTSILSTTDDFEMHIIDNNSTDDTWEYIQSLDDSRIKTRTRIGVNYGQIYALNINLTKRRPEQYFITVDNDVCIQTNDWITQFIKVFDSFPEVGLLGVPKGEPYPIQFPKVINKLNGEASYLEIENAFPDPELNYVPGCCMIFRPELINQIGYFSEENYFGDVEVSYRVNNFTNFKAGFVPAVIIKMPQETDCTTCPYYQSCTLDKTNEICLTKYNNLYKLNEFKKIYKWKFDESITDMHSGARPVYCASSSDASSTSNHIFNYDWAVENFGFFVENAN